MDASGVLMKLLDRVQLELDICKPLIPTYTHLLLSTLFPIYIGAHASLTRPASAAKPTRLKRKRGDDESAIDGENQEDSDQEDEEEETSVKKMEGLEPSDAIMFPVMAGLTLAGLYFLINWLKDPAILNKFLGFYFTQAGTVFAIAFLRDGFSLFRSLIFPSHYALDGFLWKANHRRRIFVPVGHDDLPLAVVEDEEHRRSPLPGYLGNIPLPPSFLNTLWHLRDFTYKKASVRAYIHAIVEVKSRITIFDVISTILALVAVYFFTFVTKPWWLTNFFGFSVSYGAMQFMSPTTFWTASLILGALFFYDIYFVFFTPLMVTVAQSLDIPIKLVFPRPAAPGEDPDLSRMAMLGLGDIVIPGMVIGLALRFDLFLHYKSKAALLKQPAKIPYVSATGRWGERFWTTWFASASRYSPIVHPQLLDGRLTSHEAKNFPKTYFHASLVGYVVGMLVTLLAMQISNHAQPALLYLVPGVLGSLWITALIRGDIKEMWNFSDAIEEEEDKDADIGGNNTGDKDNDKEREKEKETFPSPFGVVRKLFCKEDTFKTPAPLSKKLDRNDKDKDQTDNRAAQETSTSIDLVLFSISFPKSKRQYRKITTTNGNDRREDEDINLPVSLPTKRVDGTEEGEEEFDISDHESESSSSSTSAPVLVAAGTSADVEEPVLKKRRTRRAG
ncbi:intramembrane protease [Histoplasma capsulatum G186AR]|uniref:Intramembrane protease n=2 Tax=Ajellomyces capsulatus TaxID=5037 RepID=C0NQ56_AJECG|nr:intramembrane protease [Histoplasma capsulatum G186AR]EEH06328.1 intramembrane protease [Histoplasma capsulatum G186AR]KAG5293216.1 intramembrane protease [Histoplasma capsulatum]QSS74666.1 intramembrane protease [Histoplasma capsulatum G186AR]